MRRVFNDLKIFVLANLWIVPVVAALVWALFSFVAPPPPMEARLAPGGPSGGYHSFGLRLQAELAKEGFTLELVNSQGSVDNLAKLRAGEVELALVQSGQELSLNSEQRAELYGLGVLFQEPVWLFARQEVTVARLGELAALRVAIGSPSSGTRSDRRARTARTARRRAAATWTGLGSVAPMGTRSSSTRWRVRSRSSTTTSSSPTSAPRR